MVMVLCVSLIQSDANFCYLVFSPWLLGMQRAEVLPVLGQGDIPSEVTSGHRRCPEPLSHPKQQLSVWAVLEQAAGLL